MNEKTGPKNKYALILGSSSGFGAATALKLAEEGFHIFGVHLDRKATMPQVDELIKKIKSFGVEAVYYNTNAADEEKRKQVVSDIRKRIPEGDYITMLLHSLAFGTLKPLVDEVPENTVSRNSMIMTMDVMAHSLIYWTQELYWAGLLGYGSRIFAMTSDGSTSAFPTYGAVSAAKAALESHIRQLALELGPKGITANAIKAGVTDTPALRKIPVHQEMIDVAKKRNPAGRLTTPEDIAQVISLLVRPEAQWINGDVIAVDYGESVIDKS